MTITASNDSVTYKSPRGDTERPADLVVTVQSNGAGGFIDPTLPAAIVGNVAHDAVDTGAPLKIGGKANGGTPTAVADGDRVDAWWTSHGALAVAATSYGGGAGLDNIPGLYGFVTRDTASATVSPVAFGGFILNGNGRWDRMTKPTSASRIASAAASVNATSAKGSAGNAFKAYGNNVKASVVYLKLYNKATAPTVGTDVPVLTIPVAASGRFEIDIGGAYGFHFPTGIALAFTTDAADAGTTALLAGDILGFTLTYA